MANSKVTDDNKAVERNGDVPERLTREICDYYIEQAKDIKNRSMSDSSFSKLCKELKNRCAITEVQAMNILNGYYIKDYIAIYEQRERTISADNKNKDDRREYLEWLAQKDELGKDLNEFDLPDMD